MDILNETPFPFYICITDFGSIFLLILYHLNTTIKTSVPMAKPFIVTSMKVDEDLWKRAKKRAIDQEITLQELLNAAVQEYLKKKGPADFGRKRREN